VIIADTGFWLALANRADRWHVVAREAAEQIQERLVTTWPVMTETCHLLVARLGPPAALAFVRTARDGAFDLFELSPEHLPHIEELMEKYRDLPMDLADASLVILAKSLGSGRILSTDARDFHAYRWKNRHPFRNLLAGPPA
jgi:predicted nucleic acid-binding protein